MDGVRRALIVAGYDYQDPGLRRLRAPAHDAESLARVLHNPQIGGFDVQAMINESAQTVNESVEDFFADRRPEDLLVLHFSCHGVKDEAGELYFAMANTNLRRLASTAVPADFVNRRMNRSRSRRIVLLLDCCYAGAFGRGMTAKAGQAVHVEEQFGGRGRAVITASGAMEYAFEDAELADASEAPASVFTNALVEGLETGDADTNQDGVIDLDELYDYVYDRVKEATPNQTPGKWTFALEGGLHIARRCRPVTTPAALPPELQDAIVSPLAGVRLGAVHELERLLAGGHAGLILAAKQVLEHFREDDSRMVASAAVAALAGHSPSHRPPPQAPPRLAASTFEVDFGLIQLGAVSLPRRVRVGDPNGPTARMRVVSAPVWTDVRLVDNDLIVTFQPNEVGVLAGKILLETETGPVTVRVTARVNPPPNPQGSSPLTQPRTPAPPVVPSTTWAPQPQPATARTAPVSDTPGYYQGRTLAGVWRRIAARALDWLVVGAPLSVVLGIGIPAATATSSSFGVTVLAVGSVAVFLLDMYNRGYREGVRGQSWGKQALHLQVIRITDQRPLGPFRAIMREIAHLLSYIIYLVGLIGWLFAIWTARRQTLGDIIMRTVVLVLNEPTTRMSQPS
jgi:uncharacterized RDD family membrane protein YckC